MKDTESGFTVIEVMVAAAIAAVVIGGLVVLASRLANWSLSLDTRVQAQSAVEHLTERLTTEAASAWAVYVPSTDVTGATNSDGHEVDFFSEDGSHRPCAFAYRYDANAKSITRYSFAPGVTAVAADVIAPIDAFSATPLTLKQLPGADPLFAGASATPVSYAFAAGAGAIGGNGLVNLHLTASGVDTTLLLASATAPTTFSVVVTYTPSPPPVATPTPTPLVMTSQIPP